MTGNYGDYVERSSFEDFYGVPRLADPNKPVDSLFDSTEPVFTFDKAGTQPLATDDLIYDTNPKVGLTEGARGDV